MGFFSFFSKEKKETLDKGLSKTKESVFSKIARAVAGKSKVDDEVLDAEGAGAGRPLFRHHQAARGRVHAGSGQGTLGARRSGQDRAQ